MNNLHHINNAFFAVMNGNYPGREELGIETLNALMPMEREVLAGYDWAKRFLLSRDMDKEIRPYVSK